MPNPPEALRNLQLELALHHPLLYALCQTRDLGHSLVLVCCYFAWPPPVEGVLMPIECQRILTLLRQLRKRMTDGGAAPEQNNEEIPEGPTSPLQ